MTALPAAFLLLCLLAVAAEAQVVVGTVVNKENGEPVPEATVSLESWDGSPVAEGTTGEEGRFRIQVQNAGAYVISAASREFVRSELELVEIEATGETEVTLEVTPTNLVPSRPRLPPVDAATGEIAGHVVDSGTGTPVPGATVVLLSSSGDRISATTSSQGGVYRVRVPAPGIYQIYAEVGGFSRSETLSVEVLAERGLSLDLEAVSDPIQMEEFTVRADARFWWETEKPVVVWSYYERRRFYGLSGSGRFYDGDYLEEWDAAGVIGFVESHLPARAMTCTAPILVYLDGLPIGSAPRGILGGEAREVFGLMSLDEIEGVEMYDGSRVPAELAVPSSRSQLCAVVSVYRKR